MSDKTTRCTECRHEFSEVELVDAISCPHCGSQGVPMSISEDITLKINWHELRILCIWASNFASTFTGESARSQKALASIIAAIRAQHPEMGPLTMTEEIQELADHFNSKVTESKGGIETEFKPKRGLPQ